MDLATMLSTESAADKAKAHEKETQIAADAAARAASTKALSQWLITVVLPVLRDVKAQFIGNDFPASVTETVTPGSSITDDLKILQAATLAIANTVDADPAYKIVFKAVPAMNVVFVNAEGPAAAMPAFPSITLTDVPALEAGTVEDTVAAFASAVFATKKR